MPELTQTGTLDLPLLQREASLELVPRAAGAAADAPDERRVRLAVSSDAPVERWFGREILDHSANAVDLGRLANRAPLMLDHGRQIGVVERAWLEDNRLRAEVRFSRSPEGEAVYQDVRDGIRTKASLGYRIRETRLESVTGNEKTYRAVRWMPYEVSIVSIPADDSVGVNRSHGADDLRSVPVFSTPLPMPTENPAAPAAPAAPAVTTPATPSRSGQNDAQRILAFSRSLGLSADGLRAVEDGLDFPQFQARLEARSVATVTPAAPVSPEIGLSNRELQEFSIVAGIRQIAYGGGLTGVEKAASDAVEQKFGLRRSDRSFFIPFEVLRGGRRDLTAGSGSQGGVTVATNVFPDIIELLRGRLLVVKAGARFISGLTGNLSIPKLAAGVSATWLAETAAITPTNQTFGQVALTPKRLGAATFITRQLSMQSSVDIEGLVRADITAAFATSIDRACLWGSGAAGEPLGILMTPGIGSVANTAGAITWANVVALETSIATANADVASMTYITTPMGRGKMKTTVKDTTPGVVTTFLWEVDRYVSAEFSPAPFGSVNGYQAGATTQLTKASPTTDNNILLFGNFADCVIGMWAPMEVVVDPYTKALNHEVGLIFNGFADVAVRHPESFARTANNIL